MREIPKINSGVDKAGLKILISDNYLNFAPEYMSFLGEWITGTYKAFNDADKYTILVYLFRKNVTGSLTSGTKFLAKPTDFLAPFSLSFTDSSSNQVFLAQVGFPSK